MPHLANPILLARVLWRLACHWKTNNDPYTDIMTTDRLKHELEPLPVSAIAEPLNEALRQNTAVVVTAAPGTGKSTLLPLTILAGFRPQAGRIIILEPRRVAARQIAMRMAWLLGESVGETVGYRIRFESRVSQKTRIEVVTEGVLTRMLLDDPALEGVGTVVFDEFHERSLNSDEAFALTRQCQQLLRDDLRIVVMSATVSAEELQESLHCPVLKCDGKMFPVEVFYAESISTTDPIAVSRTTAKTILNAFRRHEGDILAFLPGEGEIRRTAELLSDTLGATKIYPLYGMLSGEEQARAIAPSLPGERKVVLATPIAETSLTIEGVRVVVDSGLCRRMVFDPGNGLGRLETVRISKDMATQRTGRAGRVAPGVCYRLWSIADEARMDPVRKPEILEADLSTLLLDAAVWGERDVERLPWLTPPPGSAVIHARTLLTTLGALDGSGKITDMGKAMSKLPCHPRIARMLLSADSPERKSLAADIAAILDAKDPLTGEADVSLERRINALRRERKAGKTGRWTNIVRAALQYAEMVKATDANNPVNPYGVGALLASAFPERIGRRREEGRGMFLLSGGALVSIDAADMLSEAEWIVVASMHHKAGGIGRAFLASIAAPSDLEAYSSEKDIIGWDSRSGAVVARTETRIGAIIMDSKPLTGNNQDSVRRVVCEAIAKEGASLFSVTDKVKGLELRLSFVARRHPELSLPPSDFQTLCESAPEWGPLFVGKARTVGELKKIDLCEVMWSRLGYEQQQAVERLAPTHIAVPSGSRIRLDYRLGAEVPVLRVRLQECFGMVDTPLVDGTPVLMELLSPGFKPVQLTSDLRSFWQTTYFEVRKELRRRYPKHAWPDNPLEAKL